MTADWHVDVASYAIGVLDAEDAARFEEHLVSCDRCAVELERLLPVGQLLAKVDRAAVLQAEHTVRSGRLLDRMRTAVTVERRRAQVRRVLVAAAAVIVAVAGMLVLSSGRSSNRPAVADTSPGPVQSTAQLAGPGGGKSTPPGLRYTATSGQSGAALELFVEDNGWGSQLTVILSRVVGPLSCTLVVLDRNGVPEPVASWSVPVAGYGTKDHLEPLRLMGATAVRAQDISRVEIRALAPDNSLFVLVALQL